MVSNEIKNAKKSAISHPDIACVSSSIFFCIHAKIVLISSFNCGSMDYIECTLTFSNHCNFPVEYYSTSEINFKEIASKNNIGSASESMLVFCCS